MTSSISQATRLLGAFLKKNEAAQEQAWMMSMRNPAFIKLTFYINGQYSGKHSFPHKKLEALRSEVTRISSVTSTSVTFQRGLHQLISHSK